MKFESTLVLTVRKCCKQTYQPKWLKNKGAILVLFWSFLCLTVYYYFVVTSKTRDIVKQHLQFTNFSSGEILVSGVFLPVGGWLADSYFGRYKVVLCGVWIMWSGAMLNGVSLLFSEVFSSYKMLVDPWVSFFSKVFMGAGVGAFQANIIQFGIDQLSEASSTEITSFIAWYTLTVFASGIIMQFSAYCETREYVAVLVVAVCLTVVLCSNFLFNHWLDKIQFINNPLPTILGTFRYVFRIGNKRQTIHTFQQQGLLSRLNIAKMVFGGPFQNEQVEDVKTFFRIMGVLAIFMIACSGIPTISYIAEKLERHLKNWPSEGCYEQTGILFIHHVVLVVAIVVYQFVVYPLFHNYFPYVSITAKFFITVSLLLVGVLALLGIESVSYHYQHANHTGIKCIFGKDDYHVNIELYWAIIPRILIGLSAFLVIFSGIEFICAQAPINMKGLILGLAYALFGLSALVQVSMSIPFLYVHSLWERAPLTCGIWYFITQVVIALLGTSVVIVMIKTYKKRIRTSAFQQLTGSVDMI